MSYLDETREKILAEGVTKSPEYARKKADDYRKAGNTNYALYKSAKTKSEAQSRYAASQSAYEKAKAWQDVLQILLKTLGGK